MSFIQVIESRLKMKYGKKVQSLSPQQLLSCNYMTEGCTGGWGIMHGYLAENAGIVAEDCAQYQQKTKGVSCSEFAACQPVARVLKTYKLPNPTELSIQQELLRNGPVITDWSAPGFMKTYKSGILDKDRSSDMELLMQ